MVLLSLNGSYASDSQQTNDDVICKQVLFQRLSSHMSFDNSKVSNKRLSKVNIEKKHFEILLIHLFLNYNSFALF